MCSQYLQPTKIDNSETAVTANILTPLQPSQNFTMGASLHVIFTFGAERAELGAKERIS